MARIRTIKPEFWQDEKLAPLPAADRLVFLGLISQADDAGRLVDNPRLLDGLLFPATDESCARSLHKLHALGRIQRYTSPSGQRLIQITGWEKHQYVKNPSPYVLPAPDPESTENGSTHGVDPVPPIPYPRSRINDPHTTAAAVQRPTKKGECSPEFQKAWEEYPPRLGGNPKPRAWKAWQARVREGVPPANLLAGLRRYAKFCHATGKLRTEYVMQAATFFGPDKRYAEAWDIPPPESGKIRPGSEASAVRRELPRESNSRPATGPTSLGDILKQTGVA